MINPAGGVPEDDSRGLTLRNDEKERQQWSESRDEESGSAEG
jgi:hypothetical protein